MYAVIESGGQQHKVEPGRYINVMRLPDDAGSEIRFERVLLVRTDDSTAIGKPLVEGAEVVGTVTRHFRGKKIRGFKYKAKKGYRRRWGARQDFTQVTIEVIRAGGEEYVAAAAAPAGSEEE